MSDILIIGYWAVIIASFISGLGESILFIVTLFKMGQSRGIKKSLIFLFVCSILTIFYSFIIAYFALTHISITNNIWIVIPIIWIITSIIFVIFSKTLLNSIKEIQEKRKIK